jgi:hypothetical protein
MQGYHMPVPDDDTVRERRFSLSCEKSSLELVTARPLGRSTQKTWSADQMSVRVELGKDERLGRRGENLSIVASLGTWRISRSLPRTGESGKSVRPHA